MATRQSPRTANEPATVTAALLELQALHDLSLKIHVPEENWRGSEVRKVALTMWRRVDEAIQSVLDLHPTQHSFRPPTIVVSLLARWLFDAMTLVIWFSKDPTRVGKYMAYGRRQRAKFMAALHPEEKHPPLPDGRGTEEVGNMEQRLKAIGWSEVYAAYRGHSEATHWNAEWLSDLLKESARGDAKDTLWERNLLHIVMNYRDFIRFSAIVCGLDVAARLDAIPSTVKALLDGPEGDPATQVGTQPPLPTPKPRRPIGKRARKRRG